MVILDQAEDISEGIRDVDGKISNLAPESEVPVTSSEESRKIRIQIGAVSRLGKDHAYYIRECDQHLRKIEAMKVYHIFSPQSRMPSRPASVITRLVN